MATQDHTVDGTEITPAPRTLPGVGATSSFVYDPQGRLFQSTINGTTTRYLYDGPNLIGEYAGASSTPLRRYVFGAAADEVLARYDVSSQTPDAPRWLLVDHQGSIIAETNENGAVAAKLTYDEYGVPGPGNVGLFQYTGQVYLSGPDLYHYKARAYSPTLGRFLQTDPTGYDDGLNWYAYVGNDPLNRFDPNGRDSIAVHFRDQPIHYRNSTIPQWISHGHSGVVTINDRTGVTTYREFGRYDGDPGKIRTMPVANLVMRKGVPTKESLKALLSDLIKIGAKSSSSDISITYNAGSNDGLMDAYAARIAREDPNWSWPAGMNCHNFCNGSVNAGGKGGETFTSTINKQNIGSVAQGIAGTAARQCLRPEEQGGCSAKNSQ